VCACVMAFTVYRSMSLASVEVVWRKCEKSSIAAVEQGDCICLLHAALSGHEQAIIMAIVLPLVGPRAVSKLVSV